jgi:hypothetical protein
MRVYRAARSSWRGGPRHSNPETIVFVSRTTRTEAFPSLAARGIDLGLDFLLAHRRDLECRKPCHGFAEARGGVVARFLLPAAEEVDEIFDLRHPLGRQLLQFLD